MKPGASRHQENPEKGRHHRSHRKSVGNRDRPPRRLRAPVTSWRGVLSAGANPCSEISCGNRRHGFLAIKCIWDCRVLEQGLSDQSQSTVNEAQTEGGTRPWGVVPTSRNHAPQEPAVRRRGWLPDQGKSTSDRRSGPLPAACAQREWGGYLGDVFDHGLFVLRSVSSRFPFMYL